jgi:hypothetical protein
MVPESDGGTAYVPRIPSVGSFSNTKDSDINGCQPKQKGSADRKKGAFFTAAFSMACRHNKWWMAPPPPRGPLPKLLKGKVEGTDFEISAYKVDRNGDGFIDWSEFTDLLLVPYLRIFFGTSNQSPWVIRLN